MFVVAPSFHIAQKQRPFRIRDVVRHIVQFPLGYRVMGSQRGKTKRMKENSPCNNYNGSHNPNCVIRRVRNLRIEEPAGV